MSSTINNTYDKKNVRKTNGEKMNRIDMLSTFRQIKLENYSTLNIIKMFVSVTTRDISKYLRFINKLTCLFSVCKSVMICKQAPYKLIKLAIFTI